MEGDFFGHRPGIILYKLRIAGMLFQMGIIIDRGTVKGCKLLSLVLMCITVMVGAKLFFP